MRRFRGVVLTTQAVLTESMYLLGRVRGSDACLEFFTPGGAVLVPASRESLVRCKTLKTYTVFTLDRRGFSAFRGERGERFRVRPPRSTRRGAPL